MATYQWISSNDGQQCRDEIQSSLKELGLEVDSTISQGATIYTCDAVGSNVPPYSRVVVIISTTNRSKNELQVEVRSSEPMIKKSTRCQTIAQALKAMIPPRKE